MIIKLVDITFHVNITFVIQAIDSDILAIYATSILMKFVVKLNVQVQYHKYMLHVYFYFGPSKINSSRFLNEIVRLSLFAFFSAYLVNQIRYIETMWP